MKSQLFEFTLSQLWEVRVYLNLITSWSWMIYFPWAKAGVDMQASVWLVEAEPGPMDKCESMIWSVHSVTMAFLWIVSCFAFISAAYGKRDSAAWSLGRSLAPHTLKLHLNSVPLLTLGCCMLARLRHPGHPSPGDRLRPHRQRWGGRPALLALAGVSAGESQIRMMSSWHSLWLEPVHAVFCALVTTPVSPFLNSAIQRIPFLRRFPDQRELGGHCCSLQCQVSAFPLRFKSSLNIWSNPHFMNLVMYE